MSNRFVSGGTISSSGEVTKDTLPSDAQPVGGGSVKSKEWEAVQQELEAERKRREEQRVKAATGQEQSLYDVLQANKAAKQAAFEEQRNFRNQFRALDDDEVGFLDEVRESKRREEECVRRETEEGLKAFRERQKTTGGSGGGGTSDAAEQENQDGEGETWGVGRKRKRVKDREREVKGVVRRRVSGSEGHEGDKASNVGENDKGAAAKLDVTKPEHSEAKEKGEVEVKTRDMGEKKSLGLVAYDSDDDSD